MMTITNLTRSRLALLIANAAIALLIIAASAIFDAATARPVSAATHTAIVPALNIVNDGLQNLSVTGEFLNDGRVLVRLTDDMIRLDADYAETLRIKWNEGSAPILFTNESGFACGTSDGALSMTCHRRHDRGRSLALVWLIQSADLPYALQVDRELCEAYTTNCTNVSGTIMMHAE